MNGSEILPQVEEFKYPGVLFMSDGRTEQEINKQIGAGSAVVWTVVYLLWRREH